MHRVMAPTVWLFFFRASFHAGRKCSETFANYFKGDALKLKCAGLLVETSPKMCRNNT